MRWWRGHKQIGGLTSPWVPETAKTRQKLEVGTKRNVILTAAQRDEQGHKNRLSVQDTACPILQPAFRVSSHFIPVLVCCNVPLVVAPNQRRNKSGTSKILHHTHHVYTQLPSKIFEPPSSCLSLSFNGCQNGNGSGDFWHPLHTSPKKRAGFSLVIKQMIFQEMLTFSLQNKTHMLQLLRTCYDCSENSLKIWRKVCRSR